MTPAFGGPPPQSTCAGVVSEERQRSSMASDAHVEGRLEGRMSAGHGELVLLRDWQSPPTSYRRKYGVPVGSANATVCVARERASLPTEAFDRTHLQAQTSRRRWAASASAEQQRVVGWDLHGWTCVGCFRTARPPGLRDCKAPIAAASPRPGRWGCSRDGAAPLRTPRVIASPPQLLASRRWWWPDLWQQQNRALRQLLHGLSVVELSSWQDAPLVDGSRFSTRRKIGGCAWPAVAGGTQVATLE
eukprot:CAMPEP_0117474478 /NCGR_PEP_ID=MMETSP0784-20121206/9304_1 /TAXON_ID=39447 /ORGANISM="" /LENGTH=245 /DNA_ID=CAMNT_0005268703 /DNA_START=159 /DNA_END=895 /DNA_ORIENTATION=+